MEEHAQDRVAALVRLFEQYGLEELIVEEGEFKLHLRRHSTAPVAAPVVMAPAPVAAPEAAPPPTEARMVDLQNTVAIRAPLIGVFYRSPSPDSPSFVNVGDLVREGQTVCIVEAMKVFNEIKSDYAGRVKDIPAKNGGLVQAGDPLVVLEFLDGRSS